MPFTIYSDTGANYFEDMAAEKQVKIIPLPFIINGEEHRSCDLALVQNVYKLLSDKADIRTSCANELEIEEALSEELEKGNDVLYLTLSSGLSATYDNAKKAEEALKEKYPERKIHIVDSLIGGPGQGLILTYACQMRDEGKSVDEIAEWIEKERLNFAALFTVESLYWLFKGGRVTKTTYRLAQLTQIKPIMHADTSGHLASLGKAIGRKGSIKSIVDKLVDTIENPEEQILFIGHGDCLEDALHLQKLIEKKIKVKGFLIDYLTPTIGAHSGPGTLSVFYKSNHRI